MISTRAGVVIMGLLIATAACSSSGASSHSAPVTTTTRVRTAGADVLQFREVLGQLPYGHGAASATSCGGGRAVTPPTANAQVILADEKKTFCYLLGPALLTGEHVSSALVDMNATTSAWEVAVHFADNEFVTKVAGPMVGKSIAIVVDGVVESAPTINAGITGRDITIDGTFDKAGARRVAEAIAPPGTTVRVIEPGPTPTTPFDPYRARCNAAGPRVGHTLVSGGSDLSVAETRAAFGRAREPVPAVLADPKTTQPFALCYVVPKTVTSPSPGTCPNGLPRIVTDPISLEVYAVDAHLNAIALPAFRYVFPGAPDGAPPLDSCGLGLTTTSPGP